MSVRRYGRRFVVGGIAAAATASPHLICQSVLGESNEGEGRGQSRPNVIYILTDDQKWGSFGFAGGKALTPHIDSLVREGVYFSRAYVPSAICTPSRYVALTGQYATRAEGAMRGPNGYGPLPKEPASTPRRVWQNAHIRFGQASIARILRGQGYATGVVGKIHSMEVGEGFQAIPHEGDPADPEIIKIFEGNRLCLQQSVRRHGFDYGASLHRANPNSRLLGGKVHYHNMEWITKGALEFIEQNKDGPFFLYMATQLLHGPPADQTLYSEDPRVPLITGAGLLPASLDGVVQPSRRSVRRRVEKAGFPRSSAGSTWLDDAVGAILQKVDALRIAENTLIVFLTDNGGSKGSVYEQGVHVPLVIRWKGTYAARSTDALVESTDIVPTILDVCGIKPPTDMHLDGRSLKPWLEDRPASRWRDAIYLEVGNTRAVCTDRWKYIACRSPQGDAAVSPAGFPLDRMPTEERRGPYVKYKHYMDSDQLYDLENDPAEQRNLAQDPAYAQTLAEMRALLKKKVQNMPGPFGEFKT